MKCQLAGILQYPNVTATISVPFLVMSFSNVIKAEEKEKFIHFVIKRLPVPIGCEGIRQTVLWPFEAVEIIGIFSLYLYLRRSKKTIR